MVSAASLRAILKQHADPVNAAGAQRFFAGGVKTYGVHREQLDGIARDAVRALRRGGGLPAALRIADGLYRSHNMDDAALAVRILTKFGRDLGPEYFSRFDRWVDSLRDWASTDSLSTQVIGRVVREHPALIRRLGVWTRSPHRWRRRASLVSLIPLAHTGEHLDRIFTMAGRLLGDADDMVQKAVGWLLKEATRRRRREVIRYLVANRDRTTRLVLRYASEKLTPAERARVLGRARAAR
ncbi:MAG: DNA alkylation repair protein [Armatimonadota bacterium]|nr:DNA alkylation repair protein [Armatimonadota bacterium]